MRSMNKIIEKIEKGKIIKKNFTRDNIFHFLLIHLVPDSPKTILKCEDDTLNYLNVL